MIEALIAGETDPNALAALAHRRIKASPADLEAALRGPCVSTIEATRSVEARQIR